MFGEKKFKLQLKNLRGKGVFLSNKLSVLLVCRPDLLVYCFSPILVFCLLSFDMEEGEGGNERERGREEGRRRERENMYLNKF